MAAEIANQLGGWPLGLEGLTFRLRNMDIIQTPAAATNPLHMYSDSFPSYSSSELDTVSTRSFFPDHGITLGSLIGMTPVDRNVRFNKSFLLEEESESSPSMNRQHEDKEMATCCTCAPFADNVIPSRSNSRCRSRF